MLDQPAAQRLGWVLIHIVWQAAVVALAMAGVLAGMRARPASERYIVGPSPTPIPIRANPRARTIRFP
jgi:hypothetical protein